MVVGRWYPAAMQCASQRLRSQRSRSATLRAMHAASDASIARAAGWMGGWLTLMVVIAVAGREAARELSVFQVMLLRSTLGMAMLWPLVRAAGGLRNR